MRDFLGSWARFLRIGMVQSCLQCVPWEMSSEKCVIHDAAMDIHQPSPMPTDTKQ